MPEPIQEEIDEELTTFLLALLGGLRVNKVPRSRWASVEPRLLWLDVSGEELRLKWGRDTGEPLERLKGESVGFGTVTGVLRGLASDVLKRSGKKANAGRYVTLVLPERSLDLECEDEAQRDFFAAQMERVVANNKLLQDGLVFLVENGLFVPPGVGDAEGDGEGAGEGEGDEDGGAGVGAGASAGDDDAEDGAEEAANDNDADGDDGRGRGAGPRGSGRNLQVARPAPPTYPPPGAGGGASPGSARSGAGGPSATSTPARTPARR